MTARRGTRWRAILGLLTAAVALALAHDGVALRLDPNDIATLRKERKRAAAKGKLPLPGTPDLKNLDDRLARRGLAPEGAMLIRIFKAESEMEVWINRGGGGAYTLFATYPICYWSGSLGPKLKEGDRQAPEGFYTVDWRLAHPGGRRWPVALDLGYPNVFDRLHVRSGSAILIHGGCASIGCFAMTNGVNKEVHKLALRALDAGQSYVHVHSFPFRMTRGNLAHFSAKEPQWAGFWRNLKQGYDLFERTRLPPRISVCNGRYTLAETGPLEGANPGPIAVCPRTQTIISDLHAINARVATLDGPPPLPLKRKISLTDASAAWHGEQGSLTQRGPNSLRQLAPETLPAGISATLTRPLQCSLLLASCRRYAALRAAVAHKEKVRLATPEKKKGKKRRSYYSKKKKRRIYY